MSNKRLLQLAAIIVSTAVMTSCAAEAAPAETNTADTQNETVTTAEETLSPMEQRLQIPDNLPEYDWGGREYRILTADSFNFHTDLWVEAQNGEQCNDAIYNRNEKIESRFNVKIALQVKTNAFNEAVPNEFNKLVMAGEDAIEIAAYCDYLAYMTIGESSCMNWYDIPMIDFDRPWHNKPANDSATVNDKLFAMCSDLSVSSLTFTYALFFNQRLGANYSIAKDTLYQLVQDGKWTIDEFIKLTRDIYADTNGNGSADDDDLYGFGCKIVNPGDVWLTAFDQPLMEYEDGEIKFKFLSEKTDAAVSLMHDYHHNVPGTVLYDLQYQEETAFAHGKLVFAPLRFYTAFNKLRDMDDDYSMLPYPKWDETQEAYYTNADDKFMVFSVPKTVSDTEFVGMIYEALCAESYRRVYPAYYDTALKGKYSSDQETANIIDLIVAGRKFDFAFQFGSVMGYIPYLFRLLLTDDSPNIASRWASTEKTLETYMEEFYAMYEDD